MIPWFANKSKWISKNIQYFYFFYVGGGGSIPI